ncbi:MAG: hypothetical protein CVU95_04060 [Firmicutes bacterium HGW-Firmicutes-2]|jgi:hypothetical protein|nr:MAG: hypothetical protein CVU95_04060 [Firmicutes bacterium HGW-Firmicutes-2]
MEPKELKAYNFLNKVYAQKDQSNKGLRTALKVGIALWAIVVVFKLLMGDFSIGSTSFIIIIYFIIRMRETGTGGFKETSSSFMFFEDHMLLVNHNIEKKDRMGLRKEQYRFDYDRVKLLEFNTALNCIRITCGAQVISSFVNQSKEIIKDYTNDVKHNQDYVYIPDEIREDFFQDIKRFTNQDILMVNQ